MADCALNVVDEREMRNLGKATRTLFVANSSDDGAAELFKLAVFVAVFDELLVVGVVLVGGLVLINLRLFAPV